MRVIFRSSGKEIADIDLPIVPKLGDTVFIETDSGHIEYKVVDLFWMIDLSTKDRNLPYICLTLARLKG